MEIANEKTNLRELMLSGIDFLTIVISRDEINKRNISTSNKLLQQLVTDKQIANYYREKIDIAFDGYNNTKIELWEIDEVRSFVLELDSVFPYWLFFLSKNGNSLFAIIKCFLLPFIKPEAEKEINGLRLKNYLENRGFPAMNHICSFTEILDSENIEMTDRFFKYIQQKK